MKKFVASAIAAAALAAGGAASAQDLGSIIANVFGLGTTTYGTPAVVATQPGQQIYADQYGRQFYYDQYGRMVYLNSQTQQIVGYDSWGRPVYSASTQPYYGSNRYDGRNSWDRDGDGVADVRDRWPSDSRYW